MPRRTQPSYGEMMDLIKDSQSMLIRIVRLPRVPPPARDLLLELIDMHAALIRRQNGRGQRAPSRAMPVEAPVSQRIS